MKKACLSAFLFIISFISAQQRTEFLLEKGWKFSRTDNPDFSQPNFNDQSWQSVKVPHDWAIYGPFSSKNDVQNVAIKQDGQTEATEHAGRTGGLPFVGDGFYRIKFKIPNYQKGKRVNLVFDGAMANATVYVNGKNVGEWPYGYNAFHFDITGFINENQENTLAVHLMNRPEQSRWYPGAGLYRNVHVVVTEDAHIPVWGTYVTTPVVNKDFAKISIKTKI